MGYQSSVEVVGPLSSYAGGLRPYLAQLGYGPGSMPAYERLLRDLSGWLVTERISAVALTEDALRRFVGARRAAGRTQWTSLGGMQSLLGYLRAVGAIPLKDASADGDAIDTVVATYAEYLRSKRRLAPITVTNAEGVVRRFLAWRLASRPGGLDLGELDATTLHAYVVYLGDRVAVGTARSIAYSLRSFVRFLFVTGISPRDLSVALQAMRSSRFAGLPKAIDAAAVGALLASCDRSRPGGRRDFAILMLLVRLGLRANEVATMRLDDVDWRAGELVIRGKGGRLDRLPLPADVGEAVADYLRCRPQTTSRAVFLRSRAPAGDITRNAVVFVSRSASSRAGIPVVGAHRLRHTAATSMLRQGASLHEIGQVLRHDSDTVTAIYAKVDRSSLDLVVRPWPGQAR